MRFTRNEGTLADHPIPRGRNSSERIDSAISFTGQAFRLAGPGDNLIALGHNVMLPCLRSIAVFKTRSEHFRIRYVTRAAIRFGKAFAGFGMDVLRPATGPQRAAAGIISDGSASIRKSCRKSWRWLIELLSRLTDIAQKNRRVGSKGKIRRTYDFRGNVRSLQARQPGKTQAGGVIRPLPNRFDQADRLPRTGRCSCGPAFRNGMSIRMMSLQAK